MKFFKGFFYFSWIFLGGISLLVIPDTIAEKNYVTLMIYLVILAFLIGLSLFLYKLLLLSATDLTISEDTITFLYSNHTTTVDISDIQKIVVTPSRYVFVLENEKVPLTRINGFMRWEKKINPQISDFASKQGVRLLQKYLA